MLILFDQKTTASDGGMGLQFQLLRRLGQEDHKFTDILGTNEDPGSNNIKLLLVIQLVHVACWLI